MTPEELKAAQEAEAAAQAAAAEAARKAAEAEGEEGTGEEGTEDPKVLKQVLSAVRREAASRRVKQAELVEKVKALEDEKRKAQEAALTEQGQFKELAEKRGQELEATRQELEQLRTKTATFEAREAEEQKKREAQVAAEYALLPEEIRADIPQDADVRTKEVAVRTYQRASGKAPPRPPSTPVTAPRAPGSTGVEPPVSEKDERMYAQIVGNTSLSREKRENAQAKLRDLSTWREQHPGR
jgi:hypothetical protein